MFVISLTVKWAHLIVVSKENISISLLSSKYGLAPSRVYSCCPFDYKTMAGPVLASLSSRLSKYFAEKISCFEFKSNRDTNFVYKMLKLFIYHELRWYTGVSKFIVEALLICPRENFPVSKSKLREIISLCIKYLNELSRTSVIRKLSFQQHLIKKHFSPLPGKHLFVSKILLYFDLWLVSYEKFLISLLHI